MTGLLFYVVIAAVVGVAIILFIGIGTFAKGGEFNRKYGNKMMRWRIIGQLIAVVLILIFIYVRSLGG
ncbi:MAG: twin transmembrane helix small protein [Rhodobacterales bacterium]|nr:twin transmembrane helix small protein [Rhodobacterales bacterium]